MCSFYFCRRVHIFYSVLSMLVSTQHYRGEHDAFYSNPSSLKYTQCNHSIKVIYGSLFNILFSLSFCMSSSLIVWKVIGFTTKFTETLLHLLPFYFVLIQLWISLQVSHLSGDIELNPGRKRDSNQSLSVLLLEFE